MAVRFNNLTAEGKRYFSELEKMAKLEIRVGYQAGVDNYEDGAQLVEVAAYNELGGSNRPPRPFMKQSFENHEPELKKASEQAIRTVNQGGTAEKGLNQLGAFAKGLVQNEIRDGDFEPNAPSTIARKGSDKPLIDTGHMRQHVQYVIKRKGE